MIGVYSNNKKRKEYYKIKNILLFLFFSIRQVDLPVSPNNG